MSTDTKIAPEYLTFMVEFAGAIFAKATLAGMAPHDSASITLMCLLAGQNPALKEEFETRLADKGQRVMDMWRHNYHNINRYNNSRVTENIRDLNFHLNQAYRKGIA